MFINLRFILPAFFILVTCVPGVYGYGAHGFTDQEISALSQTELNNIISNVPSTHPRVFLKATEIKALKARVGIGSPANYDLTTLKWRGRNITFGEMASEYASLRNKAVQFKNDPDGMQRFVDNNMRIDLIGWTAVAYAFVNLLEPDPSFVVSAKVILDRALAEPQLRHGSDGGAQVYPFAIAYDWLSNFLTPSERNRYITYMLDQVELFGFVGRSGTHFPKLYDLSNLNTATGLRALYIGFAIYNDEAGPAEINDGNGEVRKIIKDYGGYFKRVVDGIKMVGGQTGGYHEDKGHSAMALLNALEQVELWLHATGENLYGGFNTLHYMPLQNRLAAKPNGIAELSRGVHHYSYLDKGRYELIANRFQDSMVQSMADQHFGPIKGGYIWREILWQDLSLNGNLDLKNALPKVHRFTPLGHISIRSGWTIGQKTAPSKEFWAYLSSGRSFPANRQHKMGTFAIFHKGELFNNLYVGIHHNLIRLDNEAQIKKWGPKVGNPSNTWKDYEAGTKADLSRFSRFETTNTYTYALSESHEIYNLAKLDYWSREFVYLNPSLDKHYFLVYDRVTTDTASVIKKNMLTTFFQPQINANLMQIDVGGLASDNMNGRAFVKILLPENVNISSINVGNGPHHKGDPRWSTSVSPATLSLDDKFLNVMHITDSLTPVMVSTTKIDSGNMIGAHIKDHAENMVVLFSVDPSGVAPLGNIIYTISPTANTIFLVCNPPITIASAS